MNEDLIEFNAIEARRITEINAAKLDIVFGTIKNSAEVGSKEIFLMYIEVKHDLILELISRGFMVNGHTDQFGAKGYRISW